MVITRSQIPIRDRLARTRRVNEAAATCIDPHVVDVKTVDTEKHQVAGR
jgi:hypothetical protein